MTFASWFDEAQRAAHLFFFSRELKDQESAKFLELAHISRFALFAFYVKSKTQLAVEWQILESQKVKNGAPGR
jgi:hypothetical protein